MRRQRLRRVRVGALEDDAVGGERIDRRRSHIAVAVGGQSDRRGACRSEMRTIGPLTGADARAYRQPPTAASAVLERDQHQNERVAEGARQLSVQLIEGGLGQRGFGGDRIDRDRPGPDTSLRDGLVALCSASIPSLMSGLPQDGSVALAFSYHFAASSISPGGRFHFAEVEEHIATGGRTLRGLLQRRLRRLRVAPLEIRQRDADRSLSRCSDRRPAAP